MSTPPQRHGAEPSVPVDSTEVAPQLGMEGLSAEQVADIQAQAAAFTEVRVVYHTSRRVWGPCCPTDRVLCCRKSCSKRQQLLDAH
jgi:hypothetical protein